MDGGRIRLGAALLDAKGPLIALDHKGDPTAVWPYGPGYAAHCLIVGTTGGGKTSLLRFMLTDLIKTPGRKAVTLIDGKGEHSFLMFYSRPGIVDVLNNGPKPEDPLLILDTVRGFHDMVETLYAQLTEAKLTALKTGRRTQWTDPGEHFLVIDEFIYWALSLPDKARKEAMVKLKRIAAVGRAVNHRLVIATQRPDAKGLEAGLPGDLKQLLGVRIAAVGIMGMDSIESRMAFDDSTAGERIDELARKAGLDAGEDRRGLGMVQISRTQVPFLTPFIDDPLHPGTSDAERAKALRLLPPPVGEEVIG